MVAAPGSLLRRSGSGAQRSPLPSHATLPSLPPSAERWPSGRLKPPADVCPQGCENVSLRGAARSSSKRSRQRKLQRNNAMSKRARGGRGVNLWCFVPLRFSPFFAFVFRRFWRHRCPRPPWRRRRPPPHRHTTRRIAAAATPKTSFAARARPSTPSARGIVTWASISWRSTFTDRRPLKSLP